MQNIFLILATYISPPNTMGGNTKILIELLNNKKDEDRFIIITTEPVTFQRNLKNFTNIEIISISRGFSKFNFLYHLNEILFTYRTLRTQIVKYTDHTNNLFIYSASDFSPDVIPAAFAKIFTHVQWISSLYLFIPNPIENMYRKYNFPKLKYGIYFLYQLINITFIQALSNAVLITNETDKKFLNKRLRQNFYAVYGGVNVDLIKTISYNTNTYDGICCGRLHPQKGCDKLLEIWAKVVHKNSQARLAIIGNGDKNYVENLHKLEHRLNIQNNITWLGYVNGVEKYNIYQQSKVFLHTTVYDNNGMVAAEALACGLPVVMFDHPSFKSIYIEGCIKVDKYNLTRFGDEVYKLISNRSYYNSVKPSVCQVKNIREFWDWNNRVSNIYDFIMKYATN